MKRSIKMRGFTLVEMLFAVAITVVVMGAMADVMVDAARRNMITNQRIAQSIELRRFSQELIYTASRANQFFLYSSVAAADHAAPSNQLKFVPNLPDDALCPAGDFIVFVYYEFPKQTGFTYHRIQKVVCYYLDAAPGGRGAIRKVTIDLSQNILTGAPTPGAQVQDYDATNKTTVLEQVIANFWADTAHTRTDTYAISARGLLKSQTVNEGYGRLFFYRDAAVSLMVGGQLYGTTATNDNRTYTDSFCFSVTPRS